MTASQILSRFHAFKKRKLGERCTLDKVEKCQIEYMESVLKRERIKAVNEFRKRNGLL